MKTTNTYIVVEIANTHGGSLDYVKHLLRELSNVKYKFGIKFQVFKYDLLAKKDYSWYEVYQRLYFSASEWSTIFQLTNDIGKDIWMDIFDEYSLEILRQFKSDIYGIKLQASVIHNYRLLEQLEKEHLQGKKIVVNISGFSENKVLAIEQNFRDRFPHSSVILQVGFQDYPTNFDDSGLAKIADLVRRLPEAEISFADHLSSDHQEVLHLPLTASLLGAKYIEKHIRHSTLPTEFDHYSSITVERLNELFDKIAVYESLMEQPFVNNSEKAYLNKTIQIPILRTKVQAGKLVSLKNDFDYKRTDGVGLHIQEIEKRTSKGYVFTKALNAEEVVREEDIKMAVVATIIACRMKSSRLINKALLPIGEVTSVERCIKSCLTFQDVHHTILATSTVEEDSILSNYTYDPDRVLFARGEPIDVIQRYLDICQLYKIDIIIRVTADMPFVSDEIVSILLKSHFEAGADYTTARKAAIGTNIEIITVAALRKVREYFPYAEYSEYMTWYFQNNSDHFNLNFVDLPSELIREYRLTLDYQEDIDMFSNLVKGLNEKNLPINLRNIFTYLDNHPEIAELNSHCEVKYKTDRALIQLLNEKTKISST